MNPDTIRELRERLIRGQAYGTFTFSDEEAVFLASATNAVERLATLEEQVKRCCNNEIEFGELYASLYPPRQYDDFKGALKDVEEGRISKFDRKTFSQRVRELEARCAEIEPHLIEGAAIISEAMEKIAALEAQLRWHPASEPPENVENVLTWHSDFEEEMPIGFYLGSNGTWYEWASGAPANEIKVQFWRPLPPFPAEYRKDEA